MTRLREFLIMALVAAGLGCDGGSPTSPTTSIPQARQPSPAPRPAGAVAAFAEVTLSGVVYEVTPGGRVPIEQVAVYCEPCGIETHTWAYTDANGFYSFFGVWLEPLPTRVNIGKDGFGDPPGLAVPTPPNPSGAGWREVRVEGDTRFDVELVRR